MDEVLRDAAAGTLKPIYNYIERPAGARSRRRRRILPRASRCRTLNHHASFDAGRGCPFQCSFCTIINVQGRKSRRRSPDDVEHLIRAALGRRHPPLLHHRRQFRPQQGLGSDLRPHHRAARARQDRRAADHPGRHAVPQDSRTSSRRRRAPACTRVFIGLENINPANLLAAKKRQNKITEYRKMLLGLEARRRHHLCRLHPRLPGRHAGIDPRGHRDHQEGAAARHPRILLPHAAAGLRGPQGRCGRRASGWTPT